MIDHQRFLDLAAISIDFDLSPPERAEFDAHLAGCASCSEAAEAYRTDALALVALSALHLAPDRSAVILQRVVGRPRSAAPRIRMLLIAAVLALLAASVTLTVGAELLRRAREQQLSVVPDRQSVESPLPTVSLEPTEVYAVRTGGALPGDQSAPTSVAIGPGGEIVVVGGTSCVMSSDAAKPSCVTRISHAGSIEDSSLTLVDARAAASIGGDVPASGPDLGILGVAGSNEGFVAVGYADDGGFGVTVWRQEPGGPWERLPRDPVFDDARVRTIAAWDLGWMIGGEVFAPDGPRAAVWTSGDGRAWQRAEDGAVFDIGGYLDTGEEPAAGGIRDIATAGRRTILVGSACDERGEGCVAAAWVSDDGRTWRRSRMPTLDGRLVAAARLEAGFIAFVNDGRQETADGILVSDDGEGWRVATRVGFPDGVEAAASARVGSGVALAVTRNERLEIVASSDGVRWTTVKSVAFEETAGVTPEEGSVLISAVDIAEEPGGSAVVVGWVDMTNADGSTRTFVYQVSATPAR